MHYFRFQKNFDHRNQGQQKTKIMTTNAKIHLSLINVIYRNPAVNNTISLTSIKRHCVNSKTHVFYVTNQEETEEKKHPGVREISD